jgi:hypothetical protein
MNMNMHLLFQIMFEDGRSEIRDMSKEDWELVRL